MAAPTVRRKVFGVADWVKVAGGLSAISAGSRTTVWCERGYHHTNCDANPWINIPGTATDIAAGADGTDWHVNKNGDIFRYAGDQPS
nr:tectonin domain-containing protein [Streptomyces sp. PBSH9]